MAVALLKCPGVRTIQVTTSRGPMQLICLRLPGFLGPSFKIQGLEVMKILGQPSLLNHRDRHMHSFTCLPKLLVSHVGGYCVCSRPTLVNRSTQSYVSSAVRRTVYYVRSSASSSYHLTMYVAVRRYHIRHTNNFVLRTKSWFTVVW